MFPFLAIFEIVSDSLNKLLFLQIWPLQKVTELEDVARRQRTESVLVLMLSILQMILHLLAENKYSFTSTWRVMIKIKYSQSDAWQRINTALQVLGV
jgi:hypothetical protein